MPIVACCSNALTAPLRRQLDEQDRRRGLDVQELGDVINLLRSLLAQRPRQQRLCLCRSPFGSEVVRIRSNAHRPISILVAQRFHHQRPRLSFGAHAGQTVQELGGVIEQLGQQAVDLLPGLINAAAAALDRQAIDLPSVAIDPAAAALALQTI
ncbi:hypothetical protein ACP70R_043091 [Stipagrostis hirtigluma subsp. patula]